MTDVKLKAALPKDDDANGLAGNEWADRFDESNKPVVALVVLQTEEVVEKRASHTRVPKIAITRIEPVTDDAEAANLVERIEALQSERTGLVQLPVRDESVLDFDGPDAA